MKKSQHIDESLPNMNDFWAFATTNCAQMETALNAQAELLRQMQDMQKAWIAIAQELAKSSADVASRCAKCSNPGEAARLYSDWLGERMDGLFADSRRLGEQWLHLFDTALAPLKAMPGGAPPGHATAEDTRERKKEPASDRTRAASA